ncbi:MAG: hypothetical protein WCT03_09085 [Candidatus Obscuribacterales bacterium]
MFKVSSNDTIAILSLILVTVVTVFLTSGCQLNSKGERHVFNIQLPDDSGSVEVLVTNMHEFLAEYDYHVVIKPTSGESFECDLFPQTGGLLDLALEWFSKSGQCGPFVKFDHFIGQEPQSELIDLGRRETVSSSQPSSNYQSAVEKACLGRRVFLGRIDKRLEFHAR